MPNETEPVEPPEEPIKVNWPAVWLMLGVALPLAIVFWRWALGL